MNERRNPPMPAQQMRQHAVTDEPAPAGDDELYLWAQILIEHNDPPVRDGGRYLMAAYDERGRELDRLREVLAGTAPAEGSWQTEALALRAEVERLLEVNGDLMTESRQLHARDEAAKAVVQGWNDGLFRAGPTGDELIRKLARAHDPQEQNR